MRAADFAFRRLDPSLSRRLIWDRCILIPQQPLMVWGALMLPERQHGLTGPFASRLSRISTFTE